MRRLLTVVVLIVPHGLPLVGARSAQAETTFERLPLGDDETLEYALVRPDDFDPARTYPVLLALPPGRQTRAMVEAGLGRYWGEQAARRGWIVASPIAPADGLFFRGGEHAIPALLDHLEQALHVEGGRFHLAGSSNGGRSAFRVAGLHADRFHSLTVLPGYPPEADDEERLAGLTGLPVAMFVGGRDTGWIGPMRRTRDRLRELGGTCTLTIIPGAGHVPPSLDGPVMMQHLQGVRDDVLIGRVLDDFHAAAAAADGPRYFRHFTADAVFIGTDPGERWTRAEFETYAKPHFARGTGWTYVTTERHITRGPDDATAWFDEMLENERYGTCRGTGVLVRTHRGWKIAQYALTIPLPNDLTPEVVGRIRESAAPHE
ncbi:MAG: SnoaL-like domain-containing protein [Phycisphaerales bacterium]|nr:SnoaL-like domain-containing protein [Phycisphaerales bacterium]